MLARAGVAVPQPLAAAGIALGGSQIRKLARLVYLRCAWASWVQKPSKTMPPPTSMPMSLTSYMSSTGMGVFITWLHTGRVGKSRN